MCYFIIVIIVRKYEKLFSLSKFVREKNVKNTYHIQVQRSVLNVKIYTYI
jgi:hypothetical protein